MAQQKSFLDDLNSAKPESFNEEVFVSTKRNYTKLVILIVGLLLTTMFLFTLQRTTTVVLPDMTGWQLDDLQSWAKKNHDNTILTGVYSLEYPVNTFISGDTPIGHKLKKSSTLGITYSLGGDPNESIDLVDFKTMTLQEVQTWINENKLTGITIKYEDNAIVPKDAIISYEIIDGTKESFLRKNRITIYVSEGNESTDEPFEMPDFMGKTKGEVLQWADEQHIKVTINEIFNSSVEYGKVFKQSIKKETKITQKESITISISLGTPLKIPDFTSLSRTEASELAALNGITVFFKHQVSSQALDTVINQDLDAGTEIDKTQIVTLFIAKETDFITVPDFKGLSTSEATSLANLNDLKVFIKNTSSIEKIGIVVSQATLPGKTKKQGDILTLYVSSGKLLVPNFVGLTKNEATVTAQVNTIELIFNEVETTTAPNNTIIKQSIKADSTIDTSQSILLDIAINSGVLAKDLTAMSKAAAELWAAQNTVTLTIIDQYSDVYPNGTLYGQTYTNQIIPTKASITIYHSLGQVGVENFVGKTKLDIINWQNDVNSKGANITMTFASDSSTTLSKGTITNQSIKSDLVALNATITVWVSNTDNGVKIPSLDNLDESEFKQWCNANSVTYVISDSYSDTYKNGRVFGQNYANTYLPKGEFLRIYRSLGKVSISDFTNQIKSSVTSWQNQVNMFNANIKVIFVEAHSDSILAGNTIDQSIKNSEIGVNETITVTISLGPLLVE